MEGRRGVRCSRGPESFLLGPNWGLPSLWGAPVLAPGTPEGVGESTRLARNSLPVPVRSRYSAPAPLARAPPHSPRSPTGLPTPAHSPRAPGPGEKPSLPVWKSFQGIFFLALLATGRSGAGKAGGKFRCCFYCKVCVHRPPLLFFSFKNPVPHQRAVGGATCAFITPTFSPGLLWVPSPPLWTAPAGR